MGKKRTATMLVEINDKDIEKTTRDALEKAEKEIKRLEATVRRRDRTIESLRGGIDISKEKREAVREAAENLAEILEDSGWTEIDYYHWER